MCCMMMEMDKHMILNLDDIDEQEVVLLVVVIGILFLFDIGLSVGDRR